MALDLAKGAEQSAAEVRGFFEVAVVSGVFACVVPDPFGGIEFRRVGRQLEDLHVTPVLSKPLIRFLLFVIGGIVLNQEHAVSPPIKRGHQHLIQKRHISFPLEIVLLVEVDELRGVQTNRSKNLLGVPLASGGNVRLAGYSRPSGVQGGRLPERRLILEDDHRPFPPRFFLRRGYV